MENCLINKRITVKHVFKETSRFLDKKHVLYGGMMEGAFKTYTLPRTLNGEYERVLTTDEENFLEEYMNLDKGTLSVHRRKDNYWDRINVKIGKDGCFLNLSNPEEYIKYKVLLANKNFICPNLKQLEQYPLPTYEFVIVDEGEQDKVNREKVTTAMEAMKMLGAIGDDEYKLRVILEMLEQRSVSERSTLAALQDSAYGHIQTNPKKFLEVAKDQYLNSKILLRKGSDIGVITVKGGLYYWNDSEKGLVALCESGNPTIDVAAEYINYPSHADLKFKIEACIKNSPRFGGRKEVPNTDPIAEAKKEVKKK